MQPKTVIFIGPQGSGKGTQAERLRATWQNADPETPIISLETGKYFREMMDSDTYTGERIKSLLDSGQMIPDFFTKHSVLKELEGQITKDTHLTLDGFPRNERQVEFFDRLMQFYKRPLLSVVFLNVPEDVVKKRLLERGRFDDTEELIAERLRLYRENTLPLVDIYRNRTDVQFTEIDGTQAIDGIAARINEVVGV